MPTLLRSFARLAAWLCLGGLLNAPARAQASPPLFAQTNLVAWCIVPFDAKHRGPEERAQMLDRLGLRRLAYDWRAEHVPTFDAEVEAMQRHGIELVAWWFPPTLDQDAKTILAVIARHGIHPQLWVTGGGEPTKGETERRARIEAEAARVKPIAEAAARLDCQVALYNHGGWFGDPDNQLAVLDRLRGQGVTNVGLVYNFHHGHADLPRFPELWRRMQPHLLAVNLNGMVENGDQHGLMALSLGAGDRELGMLRVIRASGWQGLVGILDHRPETDSEETLRENLRGLDWLRKELTEPGSGGPRPFRLPAVTNEAMPTSAAAGQPSLSAAFGRALAGGLVVPGKAEYRALPITVECFARLRSRQAFNILVASDPKASAEHWALYSYAGNGVFSAYLPGRGGEFKSAVNIGDDRWHHVAAILERDRVRLFVDGKPALDAPARSLFGAPVPGDLAFGRLVEGGIGCDGLVDEVRIRRGTQPVGEAPSAPFQQADTDTIGLWHFDELAAVQSAPVTTHDYWAVEDAAARAALPEFQIIPAAKPEELTPANGFPKRTTYLTWHRSHGDNGGTRYSALDQINRQNVTNLQVAWTYHSRDASNNIQGNPIIVNGAMFAPTPGKHLVAVNAATGAELWRFKPAGRPAFRGLIYWPGDAGAAERVLFCAGQFLYALNPKNGQPVAGFGEDGKTVLPGVAQGDFGAATAAPAIFERIIVVPGFEKDVWGFEVVTGRHMWTFHTVPHPGEFGYDTWDRPETYGANCWGGMAMDEVRGIAYVTTGSPKPNFTGMYHLGRNLFANCLVALDARTGQRLWHFQEIRHDIWDLDIPAPPNLATITRNGRRVDVVAACTKIGNTLLLDRVTGKPVFPFRLRRAPTSEVPGEVTWPYQPDPELPEPFSKMTYSEADLTERTDEANDYALTRFKSMYHGFFQPIRQGKPTIYFGIDGGAEWTGACVDAETGRLYVTASHIGWTIALFRDDDPPYNPQASKTRGQIVFEQTCAQCHMTNRLGMGMYPPLRGLRHRLQDADVIKQIREGKNAMPAHPDMTEADLKAVVDFLMLRDRPLPPPGPRPERPAYNSNGYPKFYDYEGYPANKPPWGTLNCLDLNTGRLLWKVPLGEYPELAAEGVPKTGTENYGGAIVTAGGLVFCAGTRDYKIRAFDKDSGAELWSAKLPWTGSAPPASYEAGGRQFIVIAATGGNKLGTPYGDAYVAFALPR